MTLDYLENVKEKYHSYKGEVGKVADNVIVEIFQLLYLCKSGQQMYPNLIFVGRKCYLSPILDMNTNEIISYDLALSLI